MKARLQRLQLGLQPTGHHLHAEPEEVLEQLLQTAALGGGGSPLSHRDQAGQVDVEALLQGGVLVQVSQHLLDVRVPLQVQLDADVLRRHVTDVEERRQLARRDHVGDPLHQDRLVLGVGDGVDDDGPGAAGDLPLAPRAANADRPRPFPVDALQLLCARQDMATGREVGPLDDAAQGADLRVLVLALVVQDAEQGVAHLHGVVGRDVGGHAHGDAHGAVDQQVGAIRRQHHRFLPGAVVVRPEVHRPQSDLPQHPVRRRGAPALRVPHGGGAVPVQGAEVPGAVHQGLPHDERLRHAHQRLVDGPVPVRVVVAHHVADHLGALAVLRLGPDALLVHGEQDAALDRLEAVPHIRQRSGGDDGDRVVEVARPRRLVQRDRLLHEVHGQIRLLRPLLLPALSGQGSLPGEMSRGF